MPVIPIIISHLIACLLAYFAWRKYKTWKLITDMTPTPAADVEPGLVEVEGRVGTVSSKLLSPMTNRDCVYYQFKVQEKRTSGVGKNRRSYWRTVIDDCQAVNCTVEDASGSIEVELYKAKLLLDPDAQTRSGTFNDAPAHLENLLQMRYGASSQGWVFNKAMKYTETMLEIGDPIYAVGQAYEDGSGMIVSDGGQLPFTVTDKGEGHVSRNYIGLTIGLGFLSSLAFALAIYLMINGRL